MENLTEGKIYVGTYKKYNEGSIFGEWLELSDYSSYNEFIEACKELHKDEEDPEFMFQDFENIPEFLISENCLSRDIYEYIEIYEKIENYDSSDWVSLHNEFCGNMQNEDEIYDFDDDFFNLFFKNKPMEAAMATSFGDVNWSDNYITFNGYANLKSIRNPLDFIDQDEIIKDVFENRKNYSI